MLPDHLPRIEHPPVRLRAFEPRDAALVASVADDPLIPLVTTVPTSGSAADAQAYIQRQHDRLRAGQGYSFAIAGAALAALTHWALSLPEVERLQLHVEPWNDSSWWAAERCGYQREGLLRSWERVGSDRRDMYVYSVVAGT